MSDLKQMYNLLMQYGYDKPRVLDVIRQGNNPNIGYLISQYGESTPEIALANAYPEVFGEQEDPSVFPSDLPSLTGWNQSAYNSAQAIIENNRMIGNSDYSIDDLRRNGMSDPAILSLFRRLAGKGLI